MIMKKATDKYVPPYLRRATSEITVNSSDPQPQLLLFSANRQYFYTTHAMERKEQRGISEQSIDTACQVGVHLEHHDTTTYIDENTQVVMGNNGRIITTLDNKRNTRFDILKVSKEQEKQLLIKAKHNNDSAMCELAELYLSGNLGDREVDKAHFWLLKAANERKNSHAMCLLSDMYKSSDLGSPDPDKATEWLEKAADRGNRYALAVSGQHALSLYLEIKDHIDDTKKMELKNKIQSYLQLSADKGATRAMWQIANIYEKGLLGEINLPKAIEIYIKAGKEGSPASLESLQKLVSEGKVSEQQFEIVLNKASRLIARTSSELAVDIGLQQIDGKLGNNKERGFFMLKSAAEKNNVAAVKLLAICYEKGRGCEVNLSLSKEWYIKLKSLYEQAGDQGNVNALGNLADLFLSGKLGKVDYVRAEQAFIRATQLGDIKSYFDMGKMYIEGSLGDKPPQTGIAWIEKAIALWEERAANGDIGAIKILIYLVYLNKELGFKDYQAALRWLTILAKQQNGRAMLHLAALYLKSKIAGRNVKEAITWLLLATDLPEEELVHIAAYRIEMMMLNKGWMMQERQEIILAMLSHADQSKEDKPYRIGRILGDIYSQGCLIEPDYIKAAFWYEKAGACENSIALLRLGVLHKLGVFGKKDLVTAIEYFIRSANLGNILAQQRLVKLSNLIGTLDLKSEEMIKSWNDQYMQQTYLEKKEESDDIKESDETDNNEEIVDPKILLEKLYQKGIKEKHNDLYLAVHTLKRASSCGHDKASFELGELYASGQLGENVRSVAILFYKRAAKEKNLEAIDRLVTQYTVGTIISADPIKANKWISRLMPYS